MFIDNLLNAGKQRKFIIVTKMYAIIGIRPNAVFNELLHCVWRVFREVQLKFVVKILDPALKNFVQKHAKRVVIAYGTGRNIHRTQVQGPDSNGPQGKQYQHNTDL